MQTAVQVMLSHFINHLINLPTWGQIQVSNAKYNQKMENKLSLFFFLITKTKNKNKRTWEMFKDREYRQTKAQVSVNSGNRHFSTCQLESSSIYYHPNEIFSAGSKGPLFWHLIHWRCISYVRMQNTSHTAFSLIAFIFQVPCLIYSQLKTPSKAMTHVC